MLRWFPSLQVSQCFCTFSTGRGGRQAPSERVACEDYKDVYVFLSRSSSWAYFHPCSLTQITLKSLLLDQNEQGRVVRALIRPQQTRNTLPTVPDGKYTTKGTRLVLAAVPIEDAVNDITAQNAGVLHSENGKERGHCDHECYQQG